MRGALVARVLPSAASLAWQPLGPAAIPLRAAWLAWPVRQNVLWAPGKAQGLSGALVALLTPWVAALRQRAARFRLPLYPCECP